MKLSKRDSFNALRLFTTSDAAITEKTGMAAPAEKRKQGKPEQETLNAVLQMLRMHPKVAWAARVNSGAYKTPDGRFIRFGFPGCPDILGQMRDGRILMIECKSPIGRATEDQQAMLDKVAANNGLSGLARSVEDAIRIVEG